MRRQTGRHNITENIQPSSRSLRNYNEINIVITTNVSTERTATCVLHKSWMCKGKWTGSYRIFVEHKLSFSTPSNFFCVIGTWHLSDARLDSKITQSSSTGRWRTTRSMLTKTSLEYHGKAWLRIDITP